MREGGEGGREGEEGEEGEQPFIYRGKGEAGRDGDAMGKGLWCGGADEFLLVKPQWE